MRRAAASVIAGALPSHLAAPFEMNHEKIDWGEPVPFNMLTLRRRVESERIKRRVLRYDSMGRMIVGANRL